MSVNGVCFSWFIMYSKQSRNNSLTLKKKPISSVDLHIFGDASILGYSAVIYLVVSQLSKVNQGLVASKSRLLKKDIMIPRLKLTTTDKHQTSDRMDRQYCCFISDEGTGILQSIRREQS